jgi:hypothetical protein
MPATPVGTIPQVSSRQHLRDPARLRRVRDRIVSLFLAVGRLCLFAGMVLLFINHGRSLASHLIGSVVAVSSVLPWFISVN